MINPFQYKSESEIKDIIKNFWEDTEYLVKVRILLKVYPKFNITKLEERGVSKLWRSLSLERQKDVYNTQFKYQI
ncbi:hypothetical protein ES705_43655 [subsurface metagenome]|jgi:hypothetical protein